MCVNRIIKKKSEIRICNGETEREGGKESEPGKRESRGRKRRGEGM